MGPLIPGLGAALGAFTSLEQAHKQNKAAKQSAEAAKLAAATESKQLTDQEVQQRDRRIQESRRLKASLLAAGGASGFDLSSGDFTDAVTSSDAFATQDLDTLAINLKNTLDRVQSGLGSQLISINATKRNAFGDTLTGAVGGLGAGLQLDSNLDTINNAADRQQQILNARNATKQGGFPVT